MVLGSMYPMAVPACCHKVALTKALLWHGLVGRALALALWRPTVIKTKVVVGAA